MSLYQCLVRGENFPIKVEGIEGLVGFHTTRWVKASSPEEAEKMVLELLRSEPVFQTVEPRVGKSSGATVFFEEIVPAEHIGINRGAVWFPMNSAIKSESECKT
jgi:hypothetical protein